MYAFEYDASARILQLRLTGHWTDAEFDLFREAYLNALEAIPKSDLPIGMLSDSREFQVQSKEVAEGFAKITGLARGKAYATAIVVGSVLNRMQANRTMSNERMQTFFEIDEAREWLREKRPVSD